MVMKVYAVVSYDLLNYTPPMFVDAVYSTREAAERNLPKSDDDYIYDIKEWEVRDE